MNATYTRMADNIPEGIDPSFKISAPAIWIDVKDGSNTMQGDTFWKKMLEDISDVSQYIIHIAVMIMNKSEFNKY